MTEILYVSDGVFHPPWRARRHVKQILLGIPGIELADLPHLNYLDHIDAAHFEALVLYYHHKQLGREALAAFERFVTEGGGVLAVHSATASFREEPRYLEILGGGFSDHGPVEAFDIHSNGKDDGIFAGIGPFTVTDELYVHELQPDIQVHFTAQYEGEAQPMVWTHTFGNGRVCYVGPGHRTATMKLPEMEAILRKGLAWILEGGGS